MGISMINVKFSSNFARGEISIPNNTTIADFCENTDVNIDYGRGMTTLNGTVLTPGDFNKTFGELGITEKCQLNNVAKTDNA